MNDTDGTCYIELDLSTQHGSARVPQFSDPLEAQQYADKYGGSVYTWTTEGVQNSLVRGFFGVNVLCYVVLQPCFTLEEYDLPDDEPDWDVMYGLEKAIDDYRHGNLTKSDLCLKLAECSREMQEEDDEDLVRVGKVLEGLWRYL